MRTKREWIEVRDENGAPRRIAKVDTQRCIDTLDDDDWMSERVDFYTETGEPLRFNAVDGSFTAPNSGNRYWPTGSNPE